MQEPMIRRRVMVYISKKIMSAARYPDFRIFEFYPLCVLLALNRSSVAAGVTQTASDAMLLQKNKPSNALRANFCYNDSKTNGRVYALF